MPETAELIRLAVVGGGASGFAVVLTAMLWRHLAATRGEAQVYSLMRGELARLGEALKTLQDECAAERRQSEAQIDQLRREVGQLEAEIRTLRRERDEARSAGPRVAPHQPRGKA